MIRTPDTFVLVCSASNLWPCTDLDKEFQSYEHHLNAEKYGSDIKRQLAIQHEGYDVQLVTKRKLDDPMQLNELAQLVAAHTGARLPESAFEWPRRRIDQHDALMATF